MNRILLSLRALAVLLLLGLGTAKAQTTFQVTYDTLQFPNPDTSNFGNAVSYEFDLLNTSGSTFTDSLRFMIRVNGNAPQLLGDSGFVTIPNAVSKHFIFNDTVIAQRYGGNINIIVIWPTSPAPIAIDSMYGMLFVNEGMGINPSNRKPFDVEVYPVPTEGVLYTRIKTANAQVTETIMFDGFGKVLWRQTGLPTEIPMWDHAAGVYFVRIRLEDGRVGNFKITKR